MKFFYFSMILVVSLFMASCGSTSNNKCSKDNTNGPCDDDKVCNAGVCEAKGEPCSAQAPEGYCEKEEYVCKSGTCVDARPCSIDAPAGICEDSNKFCDTGVCKDKLSKYKLGAITQTLLKEDGKPYELLNEFHFEVMDVTGRNKRRITNDIESCINKDSCWPSDNYNYFLYLKDVGEGVYSLNIVDVPEDFNTDFTQSELVTTKLIREPVFLKDGKHFIYIENISQTNVVDLRIKKYNMETKTASEIAKFALEREVQNQDGEMVTVNIPANNFLISEDNSILVFDFEEGYNSPVEIFSLDLNNPTNPPVLFYKYVRQNSSGSGLNVGAISSDNKKLAFITDHDLQHRLHIAHLDTSDLIIEFFIYPPYKGYFCNIKSLTSFPSLV